MKNTYGIMHRITRALAANKVNIRMVNQGSSEVSIMFGIKEEDVEKAIIAIYNEFSRMAINNRFF